MRRIKNIHLFVLAFVLSSTGLKAQLFKKGDNVRVELEVQNTKISGYVQYVEDELYPTRLAFLPEDGFMANLLLSMEEMIVSMDEERFVLDLNKFPETRMKILKSNYRMVSLDCITNKFVCEEHLDGEGYLIAKEVISEEPLQLFVTKLKIEDSDKEYAYYYILMKDGEQVYMAEKHQNLEGFSEIIANYTELQEEVLDKEFTLTSEDLEPIVSRYNKWVNN